MTVLGHWGTLETCAMTDEFSVILDDGAGKSVEIPFDKDLGPAVALQVLEASGFGETGMAESLRSAIAKIQDQRDQDARIIEWVRVTKGLLITKVRAGDRLDFKKQEEFWKGGGGC